jgi:hypothetical protein
MSFVHTHKKKEHKWLKRTYTKCIILLRAQQEKKIKLEPKVDPRTRIGLEELITYSFND